MNEEDEFGMSQMSRDADPLEHEEKSAVNDHPDFNFLDSKVIHTALASDDKRTVPLWMTRSPLEDPNQWRILEVQIRPDRSWEVIKELVTTVCISKGLLLTEEHANSVLFRKKVSQELMAHGMANIAIYLNVYVRIGVSPSKMRVLDICTSVLEENKLLNGVVSTGRKSWWTVQEHTQPYEYALDQLLGALQSTLLCQCLSLSHLYMSTPETSMDSVDKAELDEGYVEDLKRAFSSEMKANIRDLCIPLESYAYDQELNCALLIGLLEPTLKKYAIKLMDTSTRDISSDGNLCESTASVRAFILNGDGSALNETQSSSLQEPKPVDLSASTQQTEANKIYGEVISEMGQNLWRACKEDCETRLRVKIREKQLQVSARVEAVHSLRRRAIRAIMEAEGAEVSSLYKAANDDRNNVLLYEASCIVNGIPVTLHVTYGNLIYRTMVPMFAHTTVISFEDVVNVTQTTSFGIHVVSIELDSSKHAKGITIAMGLEVDLLFQLLHEVFSMHRRECDENHAILPSRSELSKILGSAEEETKADESNNDGFAVTSASNPT